MLTIAEPFTSAADLKICKKHSFSDWMNIRKLLSLVFFRLLKEATVASLFYQTNQVTSVSMLTVSLIN